MIFLYICVCTLQYSIRFVPILVDENPGTKILYSVALGKNKCMPVCDLSVYGSYRYVGYICVFVRLVSAHVSHVSSAHVSLCLSPWYLSM